jgi:hypothetical protein
MIEMLTQRIQTTIITKIKAHANIVGNESLNESADALAKLGNKLPHRSPLYPYEKAHSIPYYVYKDHWPSMDETPDKGPISHLQSYLLKYDMQHSLEYIARNFLNIHKWTSDTNIDNETSTSFWNHPNITYSQKTCILKFRYNQYMGNGHKQLFFGPELYPNITCSLCHSTEPDTWKYVLLSCTQ